MGDAKIIRGNKKIVHLINITKIEETVSNFGNNIDTLDIDNETKTLLIRKVEGLIKTTTRLKPTRHRRWDSLGRAWKWMAGSPDADDLTTINSELENLTDNNNKQIILNNDLRDNMENLTGALNSLIKIETENSKSSIIRDNLIKAILTLDTLKEEIDGIQTAITLSKLNIVNSKIISTVEAEWIYQGFKDQGVTTDSMESAFHLISTTVGANEHLLVYILNIPDFDETTYTNLRIEAVVTNQQRIKLKGNHFLSNEINLFAIKTTEKKFGNWSFYKLEDLENMSNDKCISNLLKGFDSRCVYETTTTHEQIIEMNPSTVFVNEVNDTLETSCGVSSRKLTGSFLITFENCSISIRNRTFSNRIIGIVNQPLFAPSAHLKVTKEALEERINIHSLHLQNKLNLKQLHHLNLKADSHKWSLIGGFSISSTVILTLIFYICLKPKNRQTVKIQHPQPPSTELHPWGANCCPTTTQPGQQSRYYQPPALRNHIRI